MPDLVPDAVVFREAVLRDAPLLGGFHCCTNPELVYEREVEDFVQRSLLTGPPSPGLPNYKALVMIHDDELVAVGGHRLWLPSEEMPAVELVVAAISLARQGQRLQTGMPLVQRVMDELIADALDTHGGQIVTAVVHLHNHRSLNACTQAGLVRSVGEEGNYVRRGARFG